MAIRIPLCAMRDGEKENGFPRRADALLGMTGERSTERSSESVIARSEATRQSASPLCAMRNAEKKRTDSHLGLTPSSE